MKRMLRNLAYWFFSKQVRVYQSESFFSVQMEHSMTYAHKKVLMRKTAYEMVDALIRDGMIVWERRDSMSEMGYFLKAKLRVL